MLPPHCGHTKLMIEEIMLALRSPGIPSIVLIATPYRAIASGNTYSRLQQCEAQP